jgi:hypothetical protein
MSYALTTLALLVATPDTITLGPPNGPPAATILGVQGGGHSESYEARACGILREDVAAGLPKAKPLHVMWIVNGSALRSLDCPAIVPASGNPPVFAAPTEVFVQIGATWRAP